MNIPVNEKNQIFDKFVKKPEDNLKQMIHDIDKFEAKFKEDDELLNAYEREYESKKTELERKGITKSDKDKILSSITRIQERIKKLSAELDGKKQQRLEAKKVKHVVENYVLKGIHPAEQVTKSQLANIKRGYILSIVNLHNKNALSPEELRTAKDKLNSADNKEQMKRIYDHYRQLALNRAPSTQAITSEQIEQEAAEDPREEAVLKLQKFARSMKGKHTVLPKPPKHVSIKHQPIPITEQVPEIDIVEGDLLKNGELYQPKVTGVSAPTYMYDGKLVKPITPEKEDELSTAKRTVKNVVMLSPDRFKRKPYVIHSRR